VLVGIVFVCGGDRMLGDADAVDDHRELDKTERGLVVELVFVFGFVAVIPSLVGQIAMVVDNRVRAD